MGDENGEDKRQYGEGPQRQKGEKAEWKKLSDVQITDKAG